MLSEAILRPYRHADTNLQPFSSGAGNQPAQTAGRSPLFSALFLFPVSSNESCLSQNQFSNFLARKARDTLARHLPAEFHHRASRRVTRYSLRMQWRGMVTKAEQERESEGEPEEVCELFEWLKAPKQKQTNSLRLSLSTTIYSQPVRLKEPDMGAPRNLCGTNRKVRPRSPPHMPHAITHHISARCMWCVLALSPSFHNHHAHTSYARSGCPPLSP